MQFKYPELLWALFLLLVPLFIHLFQLRRFKKTPFTNVALLQKVKTQSKKARNLKKWLLLAARLFLYTALIIAFAQPYFAKKDVFKKRETVIYLDNSFSMQALNNGTTLLQNAVQELIKSNAKEKEFSLFTNTNTYKNVVLKDIQNNLLSLDYSSNQLQIKDVILKANTLFSKYNSSVKDIIVISDFQQKNEAYTIDSLQTNIYFVKQNTENFTNISIDSLYVSNTDATNLELTANLKANTNAENTAVALYNNDTLIAKTSALFNNSKEAKVNFTLPKDVGIKGKIELTDTGLMYDNNFYFNINKRDKIKVLAISNTDNTFLNKIFTNDEFKTNTTTINQLNYSLIPTQNLIILNELKAIPESLKNALTSFTKNGGSLVVIPSLKLDINSYNALLSNYFSTKLKGLINIERKVTGINFSHPLYTNVFQKRVTNFQYPTVNSSFITNSSAPSLLSYQDNSPFLMGANGFYFFTSSLSKENSNFKGSPLIVPTLYNMGYTSFKIPKLYTTLGKATTVDVETKVNKDLVLKITKDKNEFIPQQQSFTNKTTLTFSNTPQNAGIYTIKKGESELGSLSFNYNREESKLIYTDINSIANIKQSTSISQLLTNLENNQKVNELWKWFVIFALFFLILEVLIQKYFK
ncbi:MULTISPECIES: BatA domain-containing protein [unclassified Cellulophaga]|uniref:BatA domain-containing protein n=1 Tax=unclassified Cellulophaga TaxID=2634405 RepID=UPI0026E15D7C|nr:MULTISPECIES: BatA domain-containing protein [unclassified Cellulophaga]MDO6491587.1 BatA domain-containing protein [Cellulophaga sp. 2_MG-2023]MDO6493464.1 BatA domain-containing protein [Cellulophaga sp. 3_MG-2023]